MAREDLEQELLLLRIFVRGELFVPGGAGGSVDAPGIAMGNHQVGKAPVVELREELAGRARTLLAVGRQIPHRDAFPAGLGGVPILKEERQVVIRLPVVGAG